MRVVLTCARRCRSRVGVPRPCLVRAQPRSISPLHASAGERATPYTRASPMRRARPQLPASCAVPAEPARLALSSTLRVTVAKQTSSSRAEPDNVHILYAEPMIARRQNHLPPYRPAPPHAHKMRAVVYVPHASLIARRTLAPLSLPRWQGEARIYRRRAQAPRSPQAHMQSEHAQLNTRAPRS